MTIAAVSLNRGSALGTTSHSTLVVTPSATLNVGESLVLLVSKENVSGVDGFSNEVVSASSTGVTWVKIGEYRRGNGTIPGDSVVAAAFLGYVTAANTNNITLTYDAAVGRSIGLLTVWSAAASLESVALVGNLRGSQVAPGPLTISGLSLANTLFFRVIGREWGTATSPSYTPGFSNTTPVENGPSSVAGVSLVSEYIIDTATNKTSDPASSGGPSVDQATIFFALRERAESSGLFFHGGM